MASVGECTALAEKIRTEFPEYTVETDESNLIISYEGASEANEKLTVADRIFEAEGIAPVVFVPEISGQTEGKNVDAYDYTDGDANCDDSADIADAVKVLQFIANPEKYPLTAQGEFNADCDGEAGITGADAIAIQSIDAGVWES